MKLALFAAAAIAAPFLLMRRALLVRYFGFTAGLWAGFGFLALVARPFGIAVDPYLAVVACAVLNVALLWFLVATAHEIHVRWSASRAAVAVLLFYVAAVPLMMRTPPDGDEPYYILATESLVRDRDLDLSNQYRELASSVTRRKDLKPQLGDPIGPRGEIRSRHEPFLPILLIPGYMMGGLAGVLLTMALFGALLARSMIRLLEDEGIADNTTRALFPLVALGPPVVFYALRVWPEVPGAFFLVEAVRGIRSQRPLRWIPAILGLVLLKLRFVLVAAVLLVRVVRRPRHAAIAAAVIAVPLAIAWSLSGSAGNVHSIREFLPGSGSAMLRGLFGLALDGAAGIAFQAPLYLLGLIAIARWRSMPAGFRLGIAASTVYVFYLIPRAEWHGGWSPPLRYIVVFMPFLALGCATLWQKIDRGPIAILTAWTIAVVVHGMAFPWRLFQIANGENFIGETLSAAWNADFSRFFPSYIRLNTAAYAAAALLVIALIAFRNGRLISPPAVAIVLGAALLFGPRPADRIDFEDAHVMHSGGDLFPYVFQIQRFLYRGGWIARAGDSMTFLARKGESILEYQSDERSTIQLGARAYDLPATGTAYGTTRVEVDSDGRVELRCLSGKVNLDRMTHAGR